MSSSSFTLEKARDNNLFVAPLIFFLLLFFSPPLEEEEEEEENEAAFENIVGVVEVVLVF